MQVILFLYLKADVGYTFLYKMVTWGKYNLSKKQEKEM